MKFTIPGKDIIKITEIQHENVNKYQKIHLIKLKFDNPTNQKIQTVLDIYPKTNRYIINDNIKIYNNFFKRTNKKYYIENTEKDNLITFFKKNNKVLLNFFNLDHNTYNFILSYCFEDILNNTEVICINDIIYKKHKLLLDAWNGNVILINDDYAL